MIRLWVEALFGPQALWLCNKSFVPLKLVFESRLACHFNKVLCTRVGMSKCGQNFTLTRSIKLFYLCVLLTSYTKNILFAYNVECLLRVLHQVNRPVIMLGFPHILGQVPSLSSEGSGQGQLLRLPV